MASNTNRQRLIRFISIGLINTAVDVTIFLALRELRVPIFFANVISTSIALGLSYILNSRFTFQSTAQTKRSLPLFLLVTLAGLWLLQPAVIKIALVTLHTGTFDSLLVAVAGQPSSLYELLAKLAATPATLIWNYVLYKNVVFKQS